MVEEQALQSWVMQELAARQWCQRAPELIPLNGDAGSRRYFRVQAQPRLLAVISPPDALHNGGFAALADFLRRRGIKAPRVVAAAAGRGFMLVEDFGDRLLLGELGSDSADGLYGEALMTLLRLQQCPRPPQLPAYDAEPLLRELRVFQQWFVPKLLGAVLRDDECRLLEAVFQFLLDSALQQPRVLVHRDYHSRNLIVCDGGGLGLIDFQDAVWGPLTYDLVSLLKDCYVRWPRQQVRRWALTYGDMLIETGLSEPLPQSQFLRWFDLMGLQRHLKVLGVFARLSLRDGKPGYLRDLPLVIRYILEVTAAYPQLGEFGDWFVRRLLPQCEAQPWYSDYRHAGERR